MGKLKLVFFNILLIFLSACSDDYIQASENEENIPVIFNLGDSVNICQDINTRNQVENNMVLIEGNEFISVTMEEEEWNPEIFMPDIDTRTSWTTSANQVTWSTGDNIGIYMRYSPGTPVPSDRSNVLHTVNTSGSSSSALSSTSPIYLPDRVTNMKFYAYYPYSASAPANSLVLNYSLPQDQSIAQLGNADLMCSPVYTTNGSAPNVPLTFNHQMVLLSFRIKSSVLLTSGLLTKVTVSGSGVTNSGTLDLATATLTPNTSSVFSPFSTTSQLITYTTTAYVDIIINPCVITSSNQLSVTLSFGLTDHSANLVSNTPFTFVKGTRYIYNLNVALPL